MNIATLREGLEGALLNMDRAATEAVLASATAEASRSLRGLGR